jgi:hypothetical protein
VENLGTQSSIYNLRERVREIERREVEREREREKRGGEKRGGVELIDK